MIGDLNVGEGDGHVVISDMDVLAGFQSHEVR